MLPYIPKSMFACLVQSLALYHYVQVTMPSAMWTCEETMKKSWVHPESQTYEITMSSAELMLQTRKLSYKRKTDKKITH